MKYAVKLSFVGTCRIHVDCPSPDIAEVMARDVVEDHLTAMPSGLVLALTAEASEADPDEVAEFVLGHLN